MARRAGVAFIAVVLALLCSARASARTDSYLRASMPSALLSNFWGQEVKMEASILLPPSYYKDSSRRYPVLYWIQGFGGDGYVERGAEEGDALLSSTRHLKQEFIIVLLDGMFNGGHQEFADSPNNGPWGTALTTEFIPKTEQHFRANGIRFVAGHSSGGWSAMWLQITHPQFFSGEWSVSPDPLDFRDFLGPNLTIFPPQNFFKDASGHDYYIDGEKLRDFVEGPGWERHQYESFDAVFSPRGADDKPQPLFNRRTGQIDPAVQRYWDDNWDVAEILKRNWLTLGPVLHHKLHVIVGTRDTFGIDRPVRLFQQDMQALGSDAEFDYVPGANHWQVFYWNNNLFQYILNEASDLMPAASTAQ